MTMRTTYMILSALAVVTSVHAQESENDLSKHIGPVAFMWPPGRVWNADNDNEAPCGSPIGVGKRTTFPLTHGSVALVAKNESLNIDVNIAYTSDPSSNDDFSPLVSTAVKDLDEGHVCLHFPDSPDNVEDGTDATLQIQYTSDGDSSKNETYYACADIKFVGAGKFDLIIPCFNTSANSTYEGEEQDGDDKDGKAAGFNLPFSSLTVTGIVVAMFLGGVGLL